MIFLVYLFIIYKTGDLFSFFCIHFCVCVSALAQNYFFPFWIGIRTIPDDQWLFGTKAGIIQLEPLIIGKNESVLSFFLPCASTVALLVAKLTAVVNFPTFGMPICVWGPMLRLQSKKDTRSPLTVDNIYNMDLSLRQYVSPTLTNYSWWHEARLDS